MYESYINKIEVVGKLRNLKPGTIRTYQKNFSLKNVSTLLTIVQTILYS